VISGTISHYEIVGKLGEGGMGVVYKARDLRLDRFVALKFLPSHIGPDDAEYFRFVQEARAASALDHPNVCTIHDIERTAEGRAFIVMACYEGETLRSRMQRGPMPVREAVGVARRVAEGLGLAHARGIVHRDVKPANVFLTNDGTVKVLDFGIARLLDETRLTREGMPIGTVGYMSPEQARGEDVDARTDVWSLGVMLYEMLAGAGPFPGDRLAVVMHALQESEPAPIGTRRPDVPAALAAAIARAMSKDRERRFDDANALAAALAAVESGIDDASRPVSALAALRRPVLVVPVAIVLIALAASVAWLTIRSRRSVWARNEALPEIARLASERRFAEAVALATRAQEYIPGDPVLERLWGEIIVVTDVESNPAGALVEIRPYADATQPWQPLGATPIADLRLPVGAYQWRFSKAGSETVERAFQASTGTVRADLPAPGTVPEGFVRVSEGSDALMLASYGLPQEVNLGEYFVQRYEVTNRDFKKFVDAGGYRRKEFWKHEFTAGDRTLTWDEAMTLFRDKAGQPGPATWEVGTYAAGEDDFPVGGVSWYEAAAYAEFAQLSLPPLLHWYRAAGVTSGSFILPKANYDYRGPVAVGRSGAMSPYGAFDMAGNVREWVWNETGNGNRLILGGGWGEPQYMFGQLDAASPLDRSPINGFRCIRFAGSARPDARSLAPVSRVGRDYTKETPVSDETFAQFVRLHQYAPAPLDLRIEKTLETEETRVERVSFTAGYPGARVVAYMWLPKNVRPPYQTLVLFPGAEAIRPAGPEVLEQPDRYDFLIRSGRAVVHPIYHGMYERYVARPTSSSARREYAIRWSQDMRRTLDYLETRPDIDRTKVAYLGSSLGAGFSPVVLAIEPRFSLAVLLGGGLPPTRMEPEVESVNFAPRVKQPLLLLCGRYDFFLPYETSQKAFFNLIGTAPEHKKHVAVEAGHSVPRSEYLREVLSWLDRYFGPAR
jgi:formylglycine-generating enzyme required for sulfatase activity/dienelactone hydrolase